MMQHRINYNNTLYQQKQQQQQQKITTTKNTTYSQLKAYSDGSESSTASRTMARKPDMSVRPSDLTEILLLKDDTDVFTTIDCSPPGCSDDIVVCLWWSVEGVPLFRLLKMIVMFVVVIAIVFSSL